MKAREEGRAATRRIPALVLLALGLAGLRLMAQGDETLKDFQSTKYHFKVQYPASWYPLAGTSDILDITNFERTPQVPGIALKVRGAEITVTQARSDVHTPEQWVLRDLPDTDWVSKGFEVQQVDVPVSNPPAGGCLKIKRVSWRDEVAPEAYLAETNFYCQTADALYKIALSNWDGDPAQSRLRVIAIEIAQSLRTD